ncbi:hypothetical protein [Solimicrobium silvestre]|uniref:Uncharacterized protein n=1 Tax=Solimicrobium silvestre TaxID=2099400 RepID=A0A2S9H433_9BURK|nr:hypothetical protein [Solimicrobium silvestre]PRC94739.1 hypothetical protein S2091_0742 [Solimicrobium silvestre]
MKLPPYQLSKREGQPWRIPLNVSLLIFQSWVACALFALAMIGISNALGCSVNEGGTSPCLIAGMDIQILILTPTLLAVFGAPLFLIGISGSAAVALTTFLFVSMKGK